MKRKIIATMLALAVVVSMLPAMTVSASNSNNIRVVMNGRQLHFDAPARMINGRVHVPMRGIFEELGAEVIWEDLGQRIVILGENVTIVWPFAGERMYVDSFPFRVDPAVIIDGRTFVPLRLFTETLGGFTVNWDARNQTVIITSTL
jgi:hypothetical protein